MWLVVFGSLSRLCEGIKCFRDRWPGGLGAQGGGGTDLAISDTLLQSVRDLGWPRGWPGGHCLKCEELELAWWPCQ